MDESESQELVELPKFAATSPRWTGARSIELIHILNTQWVELVCELAATSFSSELPQVVLLNLDLWRLLETEARKRVAAFPFIIVDLRFKDAELWQIAAQGRLIGLSDSIYTSSLAKRFEDLILETILFARQSAREDISVAKTMFAMTSSAASAVASLTLAQVRLIAKGNGLQLRVRWDGDPAFWCDLLTASRSDEEHTLAALRRQAKLRFCGELVPMRR